MKIDPQLKQELKRYITENIEAQKKKVIIISSYELGDEELLLIERNYPFIKDATVEHVVDKNLIAGVVIKFGSRMIDLSVKGELQSLKQRIYDIH